MASQHLSDQEHQVKETEVLALSQLQGTSSGLGQARHHFFLQLREAILTAHLSS